MWEDNDYDDMFADELERDHDEPYEPDYDDSMDGDFDSAMTSAGFGTDEDYRGWDVDSEYESQYDIGDDY